MSLCGCPSPPVINRLAGNVSLPLALSQLCICRHRHTQLHLKGSATHTPCCTALQDHNLLSILLLLEAYAYILQRTLKTHVQHPLSHPSKPTYTVNTCCTHHSKSHLIGGWRKGYLPRWNTLLFSLFFFLSIWWRLSKG